MVPGPILQIQGQLGNLKDPETKAGMLRGCLEATTCLHRQVMWLLLSEASQEAFSVERHEKESCIDPLALAVTHSSFLPKGGSLEVWREGLSAQHFAWKDEE